MSDVEYRVTFGQKYRRELHPKSTLAHPDGWVSVMAPDEHSARARVVQEFGIFWAFLYGPDSDMRADLYPRGRMATLVAKECS